MKRKLYISVRLIKLAWNLNKLAFMLYLTGAVIETGGSIAGIYAGAKLSGLLARYATTGVVEGIWFWFWAIILTGLSIGFGFLCMQYSKRILYYDFVRWSSRTFLQTLNEIDLPQFYDDNTRNQINKVSSSYTWQISNLSDSNLELIYAIIRFLAITLVVSQISWWIIPVIALFLIPTLLSDAKIAKLQWFVWDQKGDERHVFWGLEQIIRNVKGQMELRSLQAAKYILNKIDRMNKSFYTEQSKRYKAAAPTLFGAMLLENVGPMIAGIVVLKQFLAKTISFDRYLFLTGALVRITGSLNTIFGTLARMQEPLHLADSFFNLIDTTPKTQNTQEGIRLSSGTTPKIEFRNVSFTYPNQSQPVFKNLNLIIESGEHVALVGENGAGKSTLIKLLLRFYRPTSGQILINDIDLNEIATETWYDQIATLFQSFNTYPLPIDENIEIGRSTSKPNKKLLDQAAEFGGVDSLVKNYKYGWSTVLDSSFTKGVEPSGGQWQRVALARAFYRKANVLILDEPTSAIDSRAEYNIFNSIFDHYQNKTTLIVSHRFSTVRRANRIIVLDQGKIIEQGSHQVLMKQNRLYHDLFTKQAEGYRE
ncbi:MAG TPA: ABC transporter ATP-binding protein [Candidatus Saccharibacteria bacterium]|nr:ABC transporter ATP-binding protein [Candidatus Saccharibacteria bacterium]